MSKKVAKKQKHIEEDGCIQQYLIKSELTLDDYNDISKIIEKIPEYRKSALCEISNEINDVSKTISDDNKHKFKIVIDTIFSKKILEKDNYNKYLYILTQILKHCNLKEYFTDVFDTIFSSNIKHS